MLNIVQMSLMMLFHPKDALDIIKRNRADFKPLRVFILMLLLAIVNYTYTFYVNYTLGTKSVTQANFFLDLALAFLPLLTWVVSSYAITAVIVGECSFTELLTASSYCIVPIILFKPIIGILSNVMTVSDSDIVTGLTFLVYAWTILLLFLSLQRLNDYSVLKTLAVTVVAIISMLIIWGVVLLLFTLVAQIVYFLQELIGEIRLKY
ncbi:MAG: YIP1 family protein [Clostridia bacterium]|nr:YIP1 family protein [Clostridia bacterium]